MARVFRPGNLKEALHFLDAECAAVLAGGTDFMLKAGRYPGAEFAVLSIGHLHELKRIAIDAANVLSLGAVCTLSEILESPLVPLFLKLPIAEIGSPAIRNAATAGGNVCNASPAGDVLPMLYALDATLVLKSHSDQHEMQIRDFIQGPGLIRIAAGQMLTEIRIPLRQTWRCTWRKVGGRRANSVSKTSFYALIDTTSRGLGDVRIALGAIAPTVVRSREAERIILDAYRGKPSQHCTEIIALYDALISPIDDSRSSRDYRRTVSLGLLENFLTEVMRI